MEIWIAMRLCTTLLALFIHEAVTSFIARLDVDMSEYTVDNVRIPMFRCSADSVGRNQSYYLDHLITWSKIGRDGREKYLSINWDLTKHGSNGGYMVSSDYMDTQSTSSPSKQSNSTSSTQNTSTSSTQNTSTSPTQNTSTSSTQNTSTSSTQNTSSPTSETRRLYFILTKQGLTQGDHGEYVCRLHDFDKNLMAEASIPVVMFDKRLSLSPYKTEVDSNTDVAVNCMFNTSGLTSLNKHDVILSHITSNGISKTIAKNGKLTKKSLQLRYSISSSLGPDGLKHNIFTIKSISKKDAGKIKCELKTGKKLLTETTTAITVDTPMLVPSPTFYLQMPVDSIAHFKCACAPNDVKSCQEYSMAWTFTNKHTGNSTLIYKDGNVTADQSLYDVIKGENGSLNLTINGVRQVDTEGEYICWLHKNGSSVEIAHASIPISVTPIAMGVLVMMERYPNNIKMLCTVTGTHWNQHYLETHSIAWYSAKNGTNSTLAVNSELTPTTDANRFSVIYYSSRYYSILIIKMLSVSDHGEYTCQLVKNQDKSIIKQETLFMYGKGNTTVFAGSYATKV